MRELISQSIVFLINSVDFPVLSFRSSVISRSLSVDPSGDELSEDSGSAGVCQPAALLPRVSHCSLHVVKVAGTTYFKSLSHRTMILVLHKTTQI